MSKLDFNGDDAWFCPPQNKYGLSKQPIKDITNDDFSFLSKINVDWNSMHGETSLVEGGVIIKNGLHTGISVVKSIDNQCFIKGTIWTEDISFEGDGKQSYDILLRVNWGPNDLHKELNIGFSYSKDKKTLSLYCNNQWETKHYEGTIIDYSNSWLWVGVCNPLDSCPPEFRQYYIGNMSYVGIFQQHMEKSDIKNIFEDLTQPHTEYNPTCIFNFDKYTNYKVLDVSGNGNNIIKFDNAWMDSI